MAQHSAVPVTLAEIAKIAGVGRAAVSNWRRRHDTFPTKIGGTDTSPQFSLAEVESWLIQQGKLKQVGGQERLWPQFDALGDRAESGLAIAAAALQHPPDSVALVDVPRIELTAPARQLAEKAASLAESEGARETFDFLLGRWLDANVRQISSTPAPLARLMVSIVNALAAGETDGPLTVLDPACGTGGLLQAAATGARKQPLVLIGTDREPALAALAAARLSFLRAEADAAVTVNVRAGDSLRADPQTGVRADVILCNPPFNERDWGYEELATDPRWAYGMPPRTEPELAWVEHVVSMLAPGGTAVVILPPAVASRRAGRRIRGALVRAGVLRSVIALPPGCAQPHSVSLQLWVLQAGDGGHSPYEGRSLQLIDAGSSETAEARAARGIDWAALQRTVPAAMRAQGAFVDGSTRSMTVPLIDLLDDEVDLTPARHVPGGAAPDDGVLRHSWERFSGLLEGLSESSAALAGIAFGGHADSPVGTTTVGELQRAGALVLQAGQLPQEGSVRTEDIGAEGIPVVTMSDVMMHSGASGWLPSQEVASAGLVVAAEGDVVVAGITRGFSAFVEPGPATVIGAQLYTLRVDRDLLDPWFLAGCLRAPANARQAGTHSSSSSRVDVRKLQVLQLPIQEQQRYGEIFRRITRLEQELKELGALADGLSRELRDGLLAGKLSPPR
jgi:methylase of polypeptide subunit release factors